MKKLTLLLAFLIPVLLTSQPCLPDGINFTNQAQIDNFQTNYPGCTEIEGGVKIFGNDITNIDSLIVLTSIGGDLDIGECFSFPNGNPTLASLSGLENLTYVGGDFLICQNHILTSLDGLDYLTQVAGTVHIGSHSNLTSISALGNLSDIGGDLIIKGNETLLNLTGLEELESINGTLNVWFNDSLIDLKGLNNISSVGGDLGIEGNEILTSLEGLENLSHVEGDVIIGCIYGWLHHNPSIKTLYGLNNLTTINGSLWINLNDSLPNLAGLESLTTIEGGITIEGNPVLKDLTGIDNLNTIGGWIGIYYNESLVSLTGLDNIGEYIITDLRIHDNISLTTCEVQSVCDYLVDSNGTIEIQNNAPGCNSQEEVEMACDTSSSIHESIFLTEISIQPNPFSNSTIVEYELNQPSKIQITIYNHLGKQVKVIEQNQSQGKQQFVWNAEGLPAGVYFCVLKTDSGTQTMKMVKL